MNDDTRLALLEQTITHIDSSLAEIKTEIKIFKQEVNQKFEKMDTKIQRLDDKVDDKFKWTMGVVITLFSGLYATALGGMIARLCHWI